MTAADDIDQLDAGPPAAFTALRAKLVAAAKERGDRDTATRIGAARRPTTAAVLDKAEATLARQA